MPTCGALHLKLMPHTYAARMRDCEKRIRVLQAGSCPPVSFRIRFGCGRFEGAFRPSPNTCLSIVFHESIVKGSSVKIVSLVAQEDTCEDMEVKCTRAPAQPDAPRHKRDRRHESTCKATDTRARHVENTQHKMHDTECRARSTRASAEQVAGEKTQQIARENMFSKLQERTRAAIETTQRQVRERTRPRQLSGTKSRALRGLG